LLPLPGNPLQAQYCGPYTILEKLGPVDYLVDTPNRRKQKRVCHANLLKLYRRRDETLFPKSANTVTVSVATVVPENDAGVSIAALSDFKKSTPTHTENKYLTQLQLTELDKLLASCADIFSDTPSKTSLATHHIALVSDTKPGSLSPYRFGPYRLHPEKAKLVQNVPPDILMKCLKLALSHILIAHGHLLL